MTFVLTAIRHPRAIATIDRIPPFHASLLSFPFSTSPLLPASTVSSHDNNSKPLLPTTWLSPLLPRHSHSISAINQANPPFNYSFKNKIVSRPRNKSKRSIDSTISGLQHFLFIHKCQHSFHRQNSRLGVNTIRMAEAEDKHLEVGAKPSKKLGQKFDYLLILDFEATCDNKVKLSPQEIIEFPVLKLNAESLRVESTFHQYVLPQYHPQLTTFCTELTGIIQDMVDGQPSLPEVLQSFHQWMQAEGLLDPTVKSAFVTCGDWDLKTMLSKQCSELNIPLRPYFRSWINIKKSYADLTTTFPKGMMNMLTDLKLKHVGRHHSGIDDCKNISNIAVELIKRGYVFRENGRLQR